MSKPYFEWRQNEPSELAQFVQADLPDALRLPKYINRLDLLTDEGPRGVVEQLYKVLLKQAINYDLAPFDPRAGVIQQIRTPQTILGSAQGTCLDLAVLLAGMCLSNDLLPIIVAVDGHAFLGVSLTNTLQNADGAAGAAAFDKGVLTDLAVLQEWAGDGDRFVFVECTGAARSKSALDPGFPEGQGRGAAGSMSFDQACQAGADQILAHMGAKDGALAAQQRAFLYALQIYDLQIKYGFPPIKTDQDPAGRPAPQVSHNQTIGGNARVGVAVSGDVHGDIASTNQSGGVNFGSGNTIGSVGDVVAGDKIDGDRISTGDITNSSGVAIGRGSQAIDAHGAQGVIGQANGPVDQRFVKTDGGDYAEGNIDKRQGAFVSGGTLHGPVVGVNSGTINSTSNLGGAPARTASGQIDLDAVYGALTRAQRQFNPHNPDLSQDLGEVLALIDAALTARENNNATREQAKIQQARSSLAALSAGEPILAAIARMLQGAG